MTKQGIEQLKKDEGLRLAPYRCTAGKLTIGYGHNLSALGITNADPISEAQAEKLLLNDVLKVEKELKAKLDWFGSAPLVVQDVLTNMGFNMGVNGLLKFVNTLYYMKIKSYVKASFLMLDSKWAEQVPLRAKRLALQIRAL